MSDGLLRLNHAVERGKALGRHALYFGCFNSIGHFLREMDGSHAKREAYDLPWGLGLMDAGLLKNGKRPDVVDGKVFWTCGGARSFWYAFYWWDRSIDSRPGSNSGFYVRGFGWPEIEPAFAYACEKFPRIVARQKPPLEIQQKEIKWPK